MEQPIMLSGEMESFAKDLYAASDKLRTATWAHRCKLHSIALQKPSIRDVNEALAFVDDLTSRIYSRSILPLPTVERADTHDLAQELETKATKTLATFYAFINALPFSD